MTRVMNDGPMTSVKGHMETMVNEGHMEIMMNEGRMMIVRKGPMIEVVNKGCIGNKDQVTEVMNKEQKRRATSKGRMTRTRGTITVGHMEKDLVLFKLIFYTH